MEFRWFPPNIPANQLAFTIKCCRSNPTTRIDAVYVALPKIVKINNPGDRPSQRVDVFFTGTPNQSGPSSVRNRPPKRKPISFGVLTYLLKPRAHCSEAKMYLLEKRVGPGGSETYGTYTTVSVRTMTCIQDHAQNSTDPTHHLASPFNDLLAALRGWDIVTRVHLGTDRPCNHTGGDHECNSSGVM